MFFDSKKMSFDLEEDPSIDLITSNVTSLVRDESGNITRIACGDDGVITDSEGCNDIDEFKLESVKEGDMVRLKLGGTDVRQLRVVYEATFAGVDEILSSSTEILDRIQRFSIGNLSFDEKYFKEDCDFLMARIDKITQLIQLLLRDRNKQDFGKAISEKLINIGGEIEILFGFAGASPEDIEKKHTNNTYINKLFIATVEAYLRRGELIKRLGEGKLTEKEKENF